MQRKNAEALQKENEDLKAENARLREALARAQVGASQPALPRRPSLTENSKASYMRPTVSSSRRAVPKEAYLDQMDVEKPDVDQSKYYKDGRLVRAVKEPEKQRHYLQPTSASQAKARSCQGGWASWSSDDDDQQTLWESEHPHPSRPSTPQSHEAECQRCIDLENACADTGSSSLAVSSRLDDVDFRRSPAARIFIPARKMFRVLASGLCIAQDIIWHAMRTHWPQVQRFYWLESPREVKLGRTELQEIFGGENVPLRQYNNLCGGPSMTVNGAILSLPELRNTVAHSNRVGLVVADGLLQDVQYLAVVLQDERRALKVRQLRDALQAEAHKALREIEALYSIMWDPLNSRRQWRIHHQLTFREVLAYRNSCGPGAEEHYKAFPDHVKNAAADWAWRCPSGNPGEHNAEYLALIEKAKSYMRETPKGQRHGSVSGGLASLTFKPVSNTANEWLTAQQEQEVADSDGWG